jgi:hypothetical protein
MKCFSDKEPLRARGQGDGEGREILLWPWQQCGEIQGNRYEGSRCEVQVWSLKL